MQTAGQQPCKRVTTIAAMNTTGRSITASRVHVVVVVVPVVAMMTMTTFASFPGG
jgi:hypothetical protein